MNLKMLLASVALFCFWMNSTGLCQPAPKIGYISLKKVSEESKKKKAFEEEIKELSQVDREKRDALRKEIQDLETALTLSGPDQAKKTEQRIAQRKRELGGLIEALNREIQRRSLVFEKEILEDISEAVQEIAKEKGYTWVLVDEILLYKDESADLTFQVLVKMNDKYIAGRPKPESPAPEEVASPEKEPISAAQEDALIETILKNGVRDRHTIKEIQPRPGRASGSITMKGSGGRVQFVPQYPKDMDPSDGVLSAPLGDNSVWRFVGSVPLSGYTFEGPDANRPLTFILLDEIGLVHLHGRGSVTFPDGKSIELQEKEAL
jgi:outer membrane protein